MTDDKARWEAVASISAAFEEMAAALKGMPVLPATNSPESMARFLTLKILEQDAFEGNHDPHVAQQRLSDLGIPDELAAETMRYLEFTAMAGAEHRALQAERQKDHDAAVASAVAQLEHLAATYPHLARQ